MDLESERVKTTGLFYMIRELPFEYGNKKQARENYVKWAYLSERGLEGRIQTTLGQL